MHTLVLHVDDALLTRMSDAAASIGTDVSVLATETLRRAYEANLDTNELPRSLEPTDASPSTPASRLGNPGNDVLAILEAVWAEQDAHPERFRPGLGLGQTEDPVEKNLSEHWAADIAKHRDS